MELLKPLYGQKLRGWLFGLTIAVIVMTTISVCSSLFQVYVIDSIVHQKQLPGGFADASDNFQTWSSILTLAVYIPFFVCFVLWLRASYRNVDLLGRLTDYKYGWAIGAFFVPFLNLVRPFQIVKEILEKSNPRFEPLRASERGLLWTWWLLFLVSGVLGQVVFRSQPKAGASAQDYLNFSWFMAASDLLDIVVNPLFLLLLIAITEKQTSRWKERQAETSLVSAPATTP